MPTLSNHRDETFKALREFGISEETSNLISHYASVFADNPGKENLGYNNKVSSSVLDYGCVSPLDVKQVEIEIKIPKIKTFKTNAPVPFSYQCKAEDKRGVNYRSTSKSQDSNDYHETVRHAMLSKSDLFGGIAGERKESYRYLEADIEGVNQLNFKYGKLITNRILEPFDFLITLEKPYFTKSERMISTTIDYKAYKLYKKDVEKLITSLEKLALQRGVRFGWEKIIQAAKLAASSDFKNWKVESDDSEGTSGLALLGVGIHALQDSKIHAGENMQHFEENIPTHIEKDYFIGDKLKVITKNAVIVFLLVSQNYKMLKPSHVTGIKPSELGMLPTDEITLSTSMIIYNSEVFKSIKNQ